MKKNRYRFFLQSTILDINKENQWRVQGWGGRRPPLASQRGGGAPLASQEGGAPLASQGRIKTLEIGIKTIKIGIKTSELRTKGTSELEQNFYNCNNNTKMKIELLR